MKLEKILNFSLFAVGMFLFFFSIIIFMQKLGDMPSGHAAHDSSTTTIWLYSPGNPTASSLDSSARNLASMAALDHSESK